MGKHKHTFYSGGYIASEGGSSPKPAFRYGKLEVWGGPCTAWPEVRSEYVLALNGELPSLPVEAVGIPDILAPTTPKGLVVDWPDYGVARFLRKEDWERIAQFFAKQEGLLYVCCGAGKGRTGTALAILAGLLGLTQTPIAFIRQVYREEAVETKEQGRYVGEITGLFEDLEALFPSKADPLALYGFYSFPSLRPSSHPPAKKNPLGERVKALWEAKIKGTPLERLRAEAIRDYGDEELYAPKAEGESLFAVVGLGSTLYIQEGEERGERFYLLFIEEETEVENADHLSSSTTLTRFLEKEENLVALLEALGEDPLTWNGGYRVGQVEVTEEGYLLGGENLPLSEAALKALS